MSGSEKRSGSTSPSGMASRADRVDDTPEATRHSDAGAVGETSASPSVGACPHTPDASRAASTSSGHHDTPHPGTTFVADRQDSSHPPRQSTGPSGPLYQGLQSSDQPKPALRGPPLPIPARVFGPMPHTPGSTATSGADPSVDGGAAQPQQRPIDSPTPAASATSSRFRSSVLAGELPVPETPPHAMTKTDEMPARRRRSRFSLLPDDVGRPTTPTASAPRRAPLFRAGASVASHGTAAADGQGASPLGFTPPSMKRQKKKEELKQDMELDDQEEDEDEQEK
ncbi:hypothetical protein GGS26DRAFT_585825 [Hypomontagnella submonticulosa]|nr:hypothetical protein GGS26DRAFT_585825 [Hypomontagnella submonticulosa]